MRPKEGKTFLFEMSSWEESKTSLIERRIWNYAAIDLTEDEVA